MRGKLCLTLGALAWVAIGGAGGCTKANPNYQDDELGVPDGGTDRVSHDGLRVDGPSADGAGHDGWPADGRRVDGPRVDGPRPADGPRRDGPRVDLPQREDARSPDQRLPDQRVPDQRVPDQRVPDQRVPDQRVPDQRVPDQGVPDQGVPDAPPPTCTQNWQCNDNLSCTTDACVGGHCQQTLVAGHCLINGVCRADGWSPFGDPCNECVSKVSTSALTFVDGKICPLGIVLRQGMCVQQACREWQQQKDVEPKLPSGTVDATVLESVDIVASTQEIWAVGHYEPQNGAAGGLIARIDTLPIMPPALPRQVLTKERLYDVSYRLAVGDSGAAYLYSGGFWGAAAWISTALGNSDRRGVFGAANSDISDVFYVAGVHNPQGSYGVVRCVEGPINGCNTNTGFGGGATLGPIFGALDAMGVGRLWVARQGSFDDVYSKLGSGSSWSDAPPPGCRDGAGGPGNVACSNTSGDYRSLHASSGSDAWIVGDNGMVLRYAGSGWQRLTLPGSTTADYQLTAVFTGTADPITTIVGHVDLAGTVRQVGLFNYNRKLDRWFGPLPVATLSAVGNSSPGQIRHVGGSGYGNLWMVGDRWAGLLNGRSVGWVLRLQ